VDGLELLFFFSSEKAETLKRLVTPQRISGLGTKITTMTNQAPPIGISAFQTTMNNRKQQFTKFFKTFSALFKRLQTGFQIFQIQAFHKAKNLKATNKQNLKGSLVAAPNL
jgi:hypothetical protein